MKLWRTREINTPVHSPLTQIKKKILLSLKSFCFLIIFGDPLINPNKDKYRLIFDLNFSSFINFKFINIIFYIKKIVKFYSITL